nr:MAG TPA: hypothetical protein [Caudoviricetes sp.]
MCLRSIFSIILISLLSSRSILCSKISSRFSPLTSVLIINLLSFLNCVS